MSVFASELTSFVEARMGAAARRRASAEDVVQDTLLALLRRLPTYPEDLNERELRARTFQIAKWKIGDLFGRPVPELFGSESMMLDGALTRPSRGTVTRADDGVHLRRIIDRMGDTYASVLRVCVLRGHSVVEAAQLLGLNEATVKKRLVRARRELLDLTQPWRQDEET